MIVALSIFISIYFILTLVGFILFCRKVFEKYKYHSSSSKSILIPFRNEEQNISSFIQAVISHPQLNLQSLLFVDDHSSDKSLQLLTKNSCDVIQNNEGEIGKKKALIKGASKLQSEFIIFNDIDIIYPNNYGKIITKNTDNDYDIAILPIWMKKQNGLLNKLIRLDFSQVFFATFSYKGNLGSGANLIVKKDSFLKYSMHYENQILSGDDYFLIKECRKAGGKVSYLLDQDLIVITEPPENIKKLISQRSRWIKKSIHKGSWNENLLSILIVLYSFIPYLLLASYLISGDTHFLVLLLIKFTTDLFVYIPALYVNRELRLIYLLPLLELIYPFYYIAVALGTFSNQKWKGRDI